MTDAGSSALTQIPNTESESSPEAFRQGPAAAISAALKASPTVKFVLNGAQIALAARADKFTQDVGMKAVEFADNRSASAVDVPDVAKAADLLYPAPPVPSSPWAWAVLGIIAGAVFSFLVTVLTPAVPEEWMPLAVTIAIVVLAACGIWAFRLISPRRRE